MKLSEIALGSKAHAELIARAQKASRTVGTLLNKVKNSTMSQHDCDAVKDACESLPRDKVLTRHDVEQIAAVADVDFYEIAGMVGLD